MTIAVSALTRGSETVATSTPGIRRALVLLVIGAAFVAGFMATDAVTSAKATALAGADLTRLLRFMATLKAGMAMAVAAAVLWRLGAAITLARFAAYTVAAAAMAAGPGLIWGMAHVGAGAALLHGGLFASILLFWFDPAVAARLDRLMRVRR